MDVLRTYLSPSRIGGPASLKSNTPKTPEAKSARSIIPLFVFFWAWKSLLLVVAVTSPGPGYDSSTTIFFDSYRPVAAHSQRQSAAEYVATRLTRWDAIYFASGSERGHVLEQEWAFSPYQARITSSMARGLCLLVPLSRNVLYHITSRILPFGIAKNHAVALTAACLHTISPAGLFLSAPYGESFFALNNFLGMLCYVVASLKYRKAETFISWTAAICMILSGVCFGQAALIRSNGLLSGIIPALDALSLLPSLPETLRRRNWKEVVHFGSILLSGSVLALAFAAPQLVAYMEYCTDGNSRPWCQRIPPSIYTWVQDHYWNVGLFRYWTVSNLPLFAVAMPMLTTLIGTSYIALIPRQLGQVVGRSDTHLNQSPKPDSVEDIQGLDGVFRHFMVRFAVPQLVLAVLAATSFHVQIINRISSGYPVWYILLAMVLHDERRQSKTISGIAKVLFSYSGWIVKIMVMYAVVQGGLYASFLPPA